MADKENTFQAQEVSKVKSATQQEIEQLQLETARVNFEIAKAQLVAQQESLVNLKFSNQEAAERRERALTKQRNAAISDAHLKADRERKQSYCNHSQGGEGLDGMYQGEGLHSTYQKETTLTGQEFFRCIRCEDEVYQRQEPEEFKRIAKLPHKGLKGPIPILFKFLDSAGNQVIVDENGKPI